MLYSKWAPIRLGDDGATGNEIKYAETMIFMKKEKCLWSKQSTKLNISINKTNIKSDIDLWHCRIVACSFWQNCAKALPFAWCNTELHWTLLSRFFSISFSCKKLNLENLLTYSVHTFQVASGSID